jgi:hypothetical protein
LKNLKEESVQIFKKLDSIIIEDESLKLYKKLDSIIIEDESLKLYRKLDSINISFGKTRELDDTARLL